jgi:hypothetical protein
VEIKGRDQNKSRVASFLQENVSAGTWDIQLPSHGTGQETYIAQTGQQICFIKLGAAIERYQIMSELGFSPPVIATGFLEKGITILVQKYVADRVPLRSEFRQTYLNKFAHITRATHKNGYLSRRRLHSFK